MKSLLIFSTIIAVSYSIGDPIIIRSNNKLIDAIGLTPHVNEVPASLDWRHKNAVLPVPDQGQCGNPQLFSTIDSISSFKTIHSRTKLVYLSQQQVFDCSVEPRICPCQGSLDHSIFNEILMQNNGSIDTAASYPYTGKCDNKCHFRRTGIGASLKAYAYNNIINETLLQTLLQTGPVVAQINVIDSFELYSGGIYADKQCTADTFLHTLLVVGYGSENGNEYWIGRNSWGKSWGENGYIRIGRNKGNVCGIASKLSLPWIVE